MMFRLSAALLLVLAFPALGTEWVDLGVPADSIPVYKVKATGPGGHRASGSAVLIAPGRLLTACHVTRFADTILVGREQLKWPAQPIFTDIGHDLCVLAASALSVATPAVIGSQDQLQLGDPVIAVGYRQGDKFTASKGVIKGLHPYDGAVVLQVSAAFDHGESGGALFDTGGRLIGIIGFKVVAGGDFHFVLPLAWAGNQIPGQLAVSLAARENRLAFWEHANAELPLFLLAASLEADRDWTKLEGVAHEWVNTDQNNPASWLCLGRALRRLKRDHAAAEAFARAAKLQ
jgi:serine protease Do